MILHLSAPYGASVNDGISKEEFSLHYSSVDDAVKLLHSYGKGTIMAKVDLKAAFRMVPVCAADWGLIGHVLEGVVLRRHLPPLWAAIRPMPIQSFCRGAALDPGNELPRVEAINYLDDFLIAGAAGRDQCAASVRVTLSVCEHLGVPVAFDKLEGPSTQITFLGILRLLRFLSRRRNWLRSYCWYNPGLVGAGLQNESYCPSSASCCLRPKWYQLGIYFCAD